MTRKFQIAVQCVAAFAQIVMPTVPGITPEWQTFGHAVLSGLQAVVAILGHQYNPDGTTAKVAYDPPKS